MALSWEALSPLMIPQNQSGGWKEVRALPIFGGTLQPEHLFQNTFQLLPCPGVFFILQPFGPVALKGTPKSPLCSVPHSGRVTEPLPKKP